MRINNLNCKLIAGLSCQSHLASAVGMDDEMLTFISRVMGMPIQAYSWLGNLILSDTDAARDFILRYFDRFRLFDGILSGVPLTILSSGSSRRQQILTGAMPGQNVLFQPTDAQEWDIEDLPGLQAALCIAVQKMIAYVGSHQQEKVPRRIITSDTMITVGQGERIGKTDQLSDHQAWLSGLMGTTVTANTGLVILSTPERKLTLDYDRAVLSFHPLSHRLNDTDRDVLIEMVREDLYHYLAPLSQRNVLTVKDIIEAYCDKQRHHGKAGGFGIQDREFFLCVRRINGDPLTIVGLPLRKLREHMQAFDICVDSERIIHQFWPTQQEQAKMEGHNV